MIREKDGYEYLDSEEFNALSDAEKSDYYDSLSKERKGALTAESKERVLKAYLELGKYRSAQHFASELSAEVEKQRIADAEYVQERKKKGIKVISLLCAAIAVVVVLVVVISLADSKGEKYDKAVALYNEGKYSEALDIFNTISKYQDSDLYITSINGMLTTGTINGERAREGDTVTIGSWYKNGDHSAAKEAIKWLVLEVDQEKGRAFLISVDILDAQAFGSTDVWKNTEILTWLNGEFLDGAFSSAEKAKLDTELYGEYDENADTVIGFSSKIALMSKQEKQDYLTDIMNVKAEGAGQTEWWLRTPAGDGKIIYITENGQMATAGKVPSETIGVRPVMWVNFD